MLNNQPSEVNVDTTIASDTSRDSAPASQEARRATEEAGAESRRRGAPALGDTQVVAKSKRRCKSAADKRRILIEADACTQPGEIGALLRREGVYSSSLSTWRHQRQAADLLALEAQKRGPKPNADLAQTRLVQQLTHEKQSLQNQLDKALLVIDVQKKVSMLIGLTLGNPAPGSNSCKA